MKGFKLPDWMRPYMGSVVSGVVTVAITAIATKVPLVNQVITEDTVKHVAEGATGWILLHGFKNVANAKINPTNSATGELAKSVPETTVPKSVGPTYTPQPGDSI